MIIRIFAVTVPLELHEEFQEKFKEISAPFVNSFSGMVGMEIGGPTKWNPNDFVVISKWNSVAELIAFAGENWNQAHIPKGMEKYVESCTVCHYENID